MSNPKCDTITDTEEARNLKLISNILTEEAIVGPYSRKVWEHFVQSPFLERGFRASREQAAALFNPVRCATPISIARLDQQVIIDKGLDPCAVCLDEFLVGSRVTRMPCSPGPCGLVVPPGVSHERRPGFYPPKVRQSFLSSLVGYFRPQVGTLVVGGNGLPEQGELFSFFFLFAMLEEATEGWLVLAMGCWLSESDSSTGLDGEGEAMFASSGCQSQAKQALVAVGNGLPKQGGWWVLAMICWLSEAIGGWLVLAMVCWLSESDSGTSLDGEGEAMFASFGCQSQAKQKMNFFLFLPLCNVGRNHMGVGWCWPWCVGCSKPQGVGWCWPWCAGCTSQTRAPAWMVKEKLCLLVLVVKVRRSILSLFLSGILSATSRALVAGGNGLPEQDELFSFFILLAMLEEATGGRLVLAMVSWLSESDSGTGLDGEGEAMFASSGCQSQAKQCVNILSLFLSGILSATSRALVTGGNGPPEQGNASQTRASAWMVKEKPCLLVLVVKVRRSSV
uniref:Uncharacterized protein n=1 Tax=Fagus sylvatica TaxID=28930 RepID=A0A2N9HA66_FAGSY